MGKRKKEIEFNPADYEYMDSMPLFGWIYEIKRRSKEYRDHYSIYKKDGVLNYIAVPSEDEDILFEDDYGAFDPNKKWSPILYAESERYLSGTEPVKFYNLKWANKIEVTHNPDGRAEEESRITEEIMPHAKVIKRYQKKNNKLFLSCNSEQQDKFGKYIFLTDHPFDAISDHMGKENIVMVLVDIAAPMSIDKMLVPIKQNLVAWRKRLKLPGSERRSPKILHGKTKNKLIGNAPIWKSYLIVYDLKEQEGLSFTEICKVLEQFDKFYNEETNVKRHYYTAVKLINGGYKKYL